MYRLIHRLKIILRFRNRRTKLSFFSKDFWSSVFSLPQFGNTVLFIYIQYYYYFFSFVIVQYYSRFKCFTIQILRFRRRTSLIIRQFMHLLQILHQLTYARIAAPNASRLKGGQKFTHRNKSSLLIVEHIEEHIFGIALLLLAMTVIRSSSFSSGREWQRVESSRDGVRKKKF